jgi:hypothetical protein
MFLVVVVRIGWGEWGYRTRRPPATYFDVMVNLRNIVATTVTL